MKKFALVLVVAIIALSGVFAIDYSKNSVTFSVSPYTVNWVVPVLPSFANETAKSLYGAGIGISYQFAHSQQYGLEGLFKFVGLHYENFPRLPEGGRDKFAFDFMLKAVASVPVSQKIGLMLKAGIGVDMVSFYNNRNWNFIFGVDADLTYEFDNDLAWLLGVGFDMDFSNMDKLDYQKATSRYLSIKTGIVSYL